MPAIKDESELKSELSESARAIRTLTETEDAKRKKRNKRIYYVNGGLIAFNLAFIILDLIFGATDGVWVLVISTFWLLALTLQELDNSNLRWLAGMQSGLHDLERAEIDKFIADMTKMPKAPAKKTGKK